MKPSIFDYLPSEAAAIWKLAEAEKALPKKVSPALHKLKVVGAGLGAMGAGYFGGKVLGDVLDYGAKKLTGNPIPLETLRVPASFLSGAASMYALNKWREKERQEMNRDLEGDRDNSKRSVPGE